MLFVLLALVAGCQPSNSSSGSSSPAAVMGPNVVVNGTKPFAPLPATAIVVKESLLPINYNIGASGLLRVRDLTAGIELAADTIRSATVVRMDKDFGIYFSNTQVYSKKLDPTHRYQISIDTTVQQINAK